MTNRRPLIAGNWKMNSLLKDGVALSSGVVEKLSTVENPNCDMLICPPATFIAEAVNQTKESKMSVGGQDCHMAKNGAHTGDISAQMLKDIGCDYVIVGHSERRSDHQETNEIVNAKALAGHEAGLKVIVCIGETEAQKDAGETINVCSTQIKGSVPKGATAENTVIAYEPVWAIGTGRTPTADDVQEVHEAIRKVLAEVVGQEEADKMRVLYGGSVKPNNAEELMGLADVDGALIGGASLKVEDFWAIAQTCL
jgi:triosephosphate isomerase